MTPAPWRTGRKLGRTLYERKYTDQPSDEDRFLGIMDSPELAEQVVGAMNAVVLIRKLHTRLEVFPGYAVCSHCNGTYAGDTVSYPCLTVRALGGDDV